MAYVRFETSSVTPSFVYVSVELGVSANTSREKEAGGAGLGENAGGLESKGEGDIDSLGASSSIT